MQTATSPGLGYGLRLFGVRTILLGLSLLRADDDPATPVVRQAPLVHAADTAAAIVVLKRGELPTVLAPNSRSRRPRSTSCSPCSPTSSRDRDERNDVSR